MISVYIPTGSTEFDAVWLGCSGLVGNLTIVVTVVILSPTVNEQGLIQEVDIWGRSVIQILILNKKKLSKFTMYVKINSNQFQQIALKIA